MTIGERNLGMCQCGCRGNDEVVELINKDPELEKEVYLKTGQTYALGALPRILWIKNKMPEIYEKIDKVGMFNDWLIYKLTGVLAVEPSNGSTTGILDLQKRAWDPSIAQKCGLRSDIFSDVAECGTIIASVTEKGHKDTGLAVGTPVVTGGGDAQLGCIGVGVVNPGKRLSSAAPSGSTNLTLQTGRPIPTAASVSTVTQFPVYGSMKPLHSNRALSCAGSGMVSARRKKNWQNRPVRIPMIL